MLKLSKYEFRKNRAFMFITLGGLFLLQIYFLVSTFLEYEDHSVLSAGLLTLYTMGCFFAVFILAVVNYSKELNSKCSYLIFMTPNSALKIILSKMLTILIIGSIILCVIIAVGYLDVMFLFDTYPELGSFHDFIMELLEAFGYSWTQILFTVVYDVITFLISFFSVVTMIYLSITLSSTLLQNKRCKGFLSIAIFLGLLFANEAISNLFPIIFKNPDSYLQVAVNLLPTTIFELVVMLGCIFGSAILLERKVSL